MVHELSQYAFELPGVTEWLSGDDRVLAFQVVDEDGTGQDISSATVQWRLFDRAYQDDSADAIVTESDSGVEVVTDTRVDTSIGEFEVRVDGDVTAEEWGEYYHRPIVEQADGTRASWRGEVVLTA